MKFGLPSVTEDDSDTHGPLSRAQAEAMIATMAQVINEAGPQYVYSPPGGSSAQCRYVDDQEQPSCLIGRMLHRWGMPIDVLATQEGRGASLVSDDIEHLMDVEGFLMSSTVARLMDVAQGWQDTYSPWGVVYSKVVRQARAVWPDITVPPLTDDIDG